MEDFTLEFEALLPHISEEPVTVHLSLEVEHCSVKHREVEYEILAMSYKCCGYWTKLDDQDSADCIFLYDSLIKNKALAWVDKELYDEVEVNPYPSE